MIDYLRQTPLLLQVALLMAALLADAIAAASRLSLSSMTKTGAGKRFPA
jgi:hypothetical protein